MQYKLATSSWGNEEKEAAKNVIDSGLCTMGSITKKFEEEFAKKMGCKYAIFVNSGSSANLLAVASFFYRKNGLSLKAGDEVIVPAVSWSTTYYPLQQYGLKLKFVDVNLYDFNISIDAIKNAISPNTKAIMAVNILGMPCDMQRLIEICNENKLILIEDNCESLGATYSLGSHNTQCGTFGDVGTTSSFFSHHMSTIEGGFCLTNDEEIAHIIISLRAHGWLRNLPNENKVFNKSGNYFEDTFKFVLPGYNVRPNEVFSAIGLEQLKKLDEFVRIRKENHKYLVENLSCYIQLQHSLRNFEGYKKESSWFGFGFLTNNNQERDKIVKSLLENEIECRPIVAGNFTKNPVINYMNYEICGNLPNATKIDQCGFFIGNNPIDLKPEIDYFINILRGIK